MEFLNSIKKIKIGFEEYSLYIYIPKYLSKYQVDG